MVLYIPNMYLPYLFNKLSLEVLSLFVLSLINEQQILYMHENQSTNLLKKKNCAL